MSEWRYATPEEVEMVLDGRISEDDYRVNHNGDILLEVKEIDNGKN